MKANIKRYVKERDEMLAKRDLGELEKFIRTHAQFYPEGFAEQFAAAGEELRLCALHKMIVNAFNLPADFRKESAMWLVSRGFNLEIM